MMILEEKIGAVLVVGGGVAGMQAALDLANSGYFVYLIERSGAVGGSMAQLDKTFPTNDCSMCILSPKLVECGRHLNIQLMTLTEVERVDGELGHFTVTLRQHPRYVDMDRCISCGECARHCPVEVKDEFNEGLSIRKAIYVKYPQAVPLKYQIDPESCTKLKNDTCGKCERICPSEAIRFDDAEMIIEVQVGSIVLAPGYRTFDPAGIQTWGYGVLPNVVTAMELERLLAASGPTDGRLVRPSDGKTIGKIAFLQCVGSRDINKAGHGYCSAVCCMYAIKEAMIAKDHVKDLDISIFFTDMRTHGKDFERFYDRARQKGIKFHRCRVPSVEPAGGNGDLHFRYMTDEGKQISEEFDLVVLSVGMEIPPALRNLADRAGIELDRDRFAVTSSFTPVTTTKPGIYACGAFTGPKDIPLSVVEASAAATAAATRLSDVRYSLSRQKTFPPERDVRGEDLRIGVIVCHCGSNIADVIDTNALAAYAATLPHVTFVESSLFACSQDSQNIMRKRILEERLNRVVVAACTPRSHDALFRETLKSSGLNECLFEMANIRNQGAWVHAGEPESSTAKAKDMVRMAVAKAGLLEPLAPVSVRINPQALVIGGGLSGMVAALALADQGFPVHLVEKAAQLGGNARHLHMTWKNEPVQSYVDQLVARVREHDLITVHLKGTITNAEGFVGSFRSTIQKPTGTQIVDHGVAILATGGQALKPEEYGYGLSQNILTALEFDKLHAVGDERVKFGKSFVFIQCVGSREPGRTYCSRVCCTHSIQSAISLKEEDPSRKVYILHRDIRTYGLREELYRKARELGVIFINYDLHQKPNVLLDEDDLSVVVWDHVLHEPFSIPADMLVLATAILPTPEVRELAKLYKLPVDPDGFLHEAHEKLRPVDFATDGLFLAGLAHYPKPIDEAIAQAQAAVSRAVTVLSSRWIDLDYVKARIDETRCDDCAICLDVCPYHAISLEEIPGTEGRQRVVVKAAKCKGCGACQATCPKEGVSVAGFTHRQISAQVKAALNG